MIAFIKEKKLSESTRPYVKNSESFKPLWRSFGSLFFEELF